MTRVQVSAGAFLEKMREITEGGCLSRVLKLHVLQDFPVKKRQEVMQDRRLRICLAYLWCRLDR